MKTAPSFVKRAAAFAAGLAQQILTSIRGIAKPGEQPLFTVTPWMFLWGVALELVLCILSTHLILAQANPWLCPLLLPTLMLGQCGVWGLYMMAHEASHNAISRNPKINRWIAEICSTVILTTPLAMYLQIHGTHHIEKYLATDKDPDCRFWQKWGFVPGQSLDYYWAKFFELMRNHKYYLVFAWKRLRANFWQAQPHRRAIAWLWWAAVAGVAIGLQLWPTILVGYLIPVFIGYPLSVLFQISEHRWGWTGDPSDKTFPRLLNVEPPTSKNPWGWLCYLAWLLFNAYWSGAVLVSLKWHNHHHDNGKNWNWPMAAYSEADQRDLPKAVWGLKQHLREVFLSLSNAQPKDDDDLS